MLLQTALYVLASMHLQGLGQVTGRGTAIVYRVANGTATMAGDSQTGNGDQPNIWKTYDTCKIKASESVPALSAVAGVASIGHDDFGDLLANVVQEIKPKSADDVHALIALWNQRMGDMFAKHGMLLGRPSDDTEALVIFPSTEGAMVIVEARGYMSINFQTTKLWVRTAKSSDRIDSGIGFGHNVTQEVQEQRSERSMVYRSLLEANADPQKYVSTMVQIGESWYVLPGYGNAVAGDIDVATMTGESITWNRRKPVCG